MIRTLEKHSQEAALHQKCQHCIFWSSSFPLKSWLLNFLFIYPIPLDLDYCCQFEFWNYKSPEKQKQGHGQEFKLGIQSIWTLGQPLSRDSKWRWCSKMRTLKKKTETWFKRAEQSDFYRGMKWGTMVFPGASQTWTLGTVPHFKHIHWNTENTFALY